MDEVTDITDEPGGPCLRESLVRLAGVVGDLVEREPELRLALTEFFGAWQDLALRETEAAAERDLAAETPGEVEFVEAGSLSVDLVTRDQLQDLVDVFSSRRTEAVVPPAREAAPEEGRAKPAVSARIIAERCRLKQRACLLAAELDEHLEGGQVVVRHDEFQPLINQAKALPDCFLWMLRPETRGWIAAEDWERLGHAFDNLARSLALADALVEAPDRDEGAIQEALALAAEAQRAVRQAVVPCVPPGRNFEDNDQLAAYRWLAHQCETLRIFVARHMRVDDLADPRDWADLSARIAGLESRRSALSERLRHLNKHFGRIRYEAQRLVEAPPAEVEQRVAKIARAADDLVAAGVAPSDVRLRELLLPVFEVLEESEEVPHEGFRLAMREMDRYLASRERAVESGAGAESPPSADVERVRGWLAGREVVVVGGEERPEVVRRLRDSFALKSLIWVATRPHESNDLFRAPVQRSEVALVLLAIRWSSHSYGGIREFCEAAGKPLVRLPGGYGTNRVAREIVEQASEALG